jgi:riboflavin transporter FmnP
MALIGLFSGITYMLYIIRIPGFVFFPSFLEINLSEIPLFLVGFIYGPFASLFSLFFRFGMAIPFSTTSLIGETADLMYSAAFVLPASIIYQFKRTKSGAMYGFMFGFFLHLVVTSLLNVYWITDLYLDLYFGSAENFIGFIQQTNPSVQDPYWSLVLYVYIPFNVIKNALVMTSTLLVYKRVHVLIKKLQSNQR